MEYFATRQLSPKTIVKYGLGYAPPGWDNLRKFLREKGFSDEQMIRGGGGQQRAKRLLLRYV